MANVSVNPAASFWRCTLMKDDDYASGSSECVSTQPVKLLNSVPVKTAGFFGSDNYQQ